MKQLTVLIKPASSLCNMRCKYCFYSDVSKRREIQSFGIMKEDTVSKLLSNLFAAVDAGGELNLAFQGGEPTIAGLSWFKDFVRKADSLKTEQKIEVQYSLQTNGYVLDEEWCEFLSEHHFLVGLSLDGPKEFHDQNRIGADGKGTYRQVIRAARLLKAHSVDFNILCVLTANNARHPKKLWDFFLQNELYYLQFIPCLPEMDEKENRYSLTPQLFHDFYVTLFELWRTELHRGRYISVKLFDDMANLFVFRNVTACGINGCCNLQYVTEADGSVYPCDFYMLDQYRLGNFESDSPVQIQKVFEKSDFHELRKDLPETCMQCKYRKLCHGGCVRLRQSMYLQDQYCGYAHLLDDIGDQLIQEVSKCIRV